MEIWTSSDVAVKLGGVASLLGRLVSGTMQLLRAHIPSTGPDHSGQGSHRRLTNRPALAPVLVPIRNERRR